jgi:hypothetical protein
MRTVPLIEIVALALFIAAPVGAQNIKNEPADFRGITWASTFDQQSDALALIRQEGDVAYYKRKGEALTFGQAEAIKIAYRYYKNRFSAGVIQTYGKSNQQALVASLLSIHGEPLRPRKHIDQYVWEGKDASVVLTCEVTSYCAAEFFSTPLRKQEAGETGNATTFERDRDDD